MGTLRQIAPMLEDKEQAMDLPGACDRPGPAARAGGPPLTVGLVQINNSFSGQNYLPYSVAMLQAYAARHAPDPSRYRFLLPIYKRMPIRDIVAALAGAQVVGFSLYVWNEQISLEVIRRLKTANPEVVIIVGGPQVPDKPEDFLRRNPTIDVVVHNEGERAFLGLLEGLPADIDDSLPGVSRLRPDGTLVRNPNQPRLRDLEAVPSPFLDGFFEPLMAANPDETWIGLWETNRGCPFQCTFCDWGSATAAKVNQFEIDRLKREVDWFAAKKIEYIFCCDANFGILKRDVEIAEYVAAIKQQTGYPRALSVQNTKNATERAYQTQKILSDAGLNKGVALSMQSIDGETLKNIKRDNISLETYLELQRRFTRDRVETYSDLILGLPGETYDSFVTGIDKLIQSGQHNRIQFNNLSILPNAEMGDPDYLRRFGMVTIPSEIINIHGAREDLDDDVAEIQQLVIATDSMPAADWRRTRAFCWMVALLHFDKLFQIPLIVANELLGLSYRKFIEDVLAVDAVSYPLLAEIRDLFLREAQSIQNGGPEYVYSREWLGIYWPADEYAFIKMTSEGRMGDFYDEVGQLLLAGIDASDPLRQAAVDAIAVNRALLKQPFATGTVRQTIEFDVLTFAANIREGRREPLDRTRTTVVIDRDAARYDDFGTWCREVVWWGNKRGAYLYGGRQVGLELAGHY